MTTNSDSVERKTTTIDNGQPADVQNKKIPKAKIYGERNVLHKYRSFTHLFTLAAITKESLNDPELIRTSSDYFVVAKSSGKKSSGFDSSKASADAKDLVEAFNETSSGRFDLFLNNIDVETIMGFSRNTNLAMATKLSFEVFEPHSISGFIEALQVSAIATGHKSYMSTPFLLKMEFVGYPDSGGGGAGGAGGNSIPDATLQSVGDQATRYFIITITKVEVEMTESGTKYRCQAIPHNEMAFGTPNVLSSTIRMEGNTVGTVLDSLFEGLNKNSEAAAKTEQNKADKLIYDQYFIYYPTVDYEGKWIFDKDNLDIKNAKIVTGEQDPTNYAMPEPGAVAAANANAQKANPAISQDCVSGNTDTSIKKITAPPTKSNFQFASGSNIHDIIVSVVRDSEYGKKLLDQEPSETGMVNYFNVTTKVLIEDGWNPVTQKPVVSYNYIVSPYRMHASRIPFFQKKLSEAELDKLKIIHVKRKYDYMYTGKNVDIRKFNLRFNSLFYQAYPQGVGNNTFADPNATRTPTDNKKNVIVKIDEKISTRQVIPDAQRASDPSMAKIVKEGGNAARRDYKDYDLLVENMHRAIINNLDMVTCELEILGDPYFLCTGGTGNYFPKVTDPGITANGEAPYQSGDVVIVVEFNTPQDIGVKDQEIKFYKTPFSGCFRVTKVRSRFADGMFIQTLSLLRIPGQPEDSNLLNPGSSKAPTKYITSVAEQARNNNTMQA
jgi:hypothetical protein